MRQVTLPVRDTKDYCEKCGAPFVGAPYSRMGRRRAWIGTISPELRTAKVYEVCMECIFKVEAYLERRTSGRLRIIQAIGDPKQVKLE